MSTPYLRGSKKAKHNIERLISGINLAFVQHHFKRPRESGHGKSKVTEPEPLATTVTTE